MRVDVDGPCRIHLKGPDGKPAQPPGFPFWRDHFVVPGPHLAARTFWVNLLERATDA